MKETLILVFPLAAYSDQNKNFLLAETCPVGWVCRIHQLLLCRGVRPQPPPNECPEYDTKQSDGEVPGMRSTTSLPSSPGPT